MGTAECIWRARLRPSPGGDMVTSDGPLERRVWRASWILTWRTPAARNGAECASSVPDGPGPRPRARAERWVADTARPFAARAQPCHT